jgi:hypothetical protein
MKKRRLKQTPRESPGTTLRTHIQKIGKYGRNGQISRYL